MSFGDGGRMTQMSRAFGPQRVDALQRLAEDFLVKEKNGIEGLILAAGRQVTMPSQAGQETFQFLLTGKGIGHVIEGGHEMAQPIDIIGFGREGFVLTPENISQSFDGQR